MILSFITRFSLDRRVTNLNKSIKQKEAIIKSYGELENSFRLTQKKISSIQQLQPENNITEVFPRLQEVAPENFQLESLTINPGGVNLTARALTDEALNTFISNLQISPYFTEVNVGKIETEGEEEPGFMVMVAAKTHLQLIEQAREVPTTE